MFEMSEMDKNDVVISTGLKSQLDDSVKKADQYKSIAHSVEENLEEQNKVRVLFFYFEYLIFCPFCWCIYIYIYIYFYIKHLICYDCGYLINMWIHIGI